jgi:hypothetical protein
MCWLSFLASSPDTPMVVALNRNCAAEVGSCRGGRDGKVGSLRCRPHKGRITALVEG